MSYQKFAYYYDSLMDPQFYNDYEDFILKHTDANFFLELGCGTGEIAIRLLKKEKSILATDLSEDMLYVASEKASSEGLCLDVQQADMIDFQVTHPVDCVLCLCDSLNYIIDKNDIIKVFSNVYQALKPKGIFIFDINSMYKCNIILDNYHEESHDEDYDFYWDVTSNNRGDIYHHIIINDRENNEQIDEIHHQKTYELDIYKSLLDNTGFTYEIFSDFDKYNEESERLIFVCRKGE
ncbi:class I SAM-dependent DNA methyltransferase [Eggerthia catenaformis]|uniref:class I SAM-dependent DNA methyltransferase n=1 Tax=Eggerthia catenaformis TaxID=31973 RepID=UPI00248F3B35|nr:class I SAM-dependent methyltransferase [Eggerthia catenaformis]